MWQPWIKRDHTAASYSTSQCGFGSVGFSFTLHSFWQLPSYITTSPLCWLPWLVSSFSQRWYPLPEVFSPRCDLWLHQLDIFTTYCSLRQNESFLINHLSRYGLLLYHIFCVDLFRTRRFHSLQSSGIFSYENDINRRRCSQEIR